MTTDNTPPKSYSVILKDRGAHTINVIKELRYLLNVPLPEIYRIVLNLPKTIKECVTAEEAEVARTTLASVGAVVEVVEC